MSSRRAFRPPSHLAEGDSMPGAHAPRLPWDQLLRLARSDGRLVADSFTPPIPPTLEEIPSDLHSSVLQGLRSLGVSHLYSHQAEALQAVFHSPIIVTTSTASGKSLCFNLPTLEVLCRDPKARALYIYPTKALAQDQARALQAFALQHRIRPAIYDGDTPKQARAEIRRSSNVVITNPDMLHLGILPNHQSWAQLFSNLALVVVDEAHVYRGVFGSHVANLLRRLRRVASAYRTSPRFILTSATIANPIQLAQRLTGLDDFTLIDVDGAPSPARQIAVWNPPIIDRRLGSRASAIGEAAQIIETLVSEGARVICFVRSRKAVELLTRLVRDRLLSSDPHLSQLVVPYRAGYTPQQRRELERRLVVGEVRAVISTDALELGIDIGQLDAALVVTFPGTIASLRQMWGRAGRRSTGLSLYIAGEDALDQFFARHPHQFLERPVESVILNHLSAQVHLPHLLCAAHEAPLSAEDERFFGPDLHSCAEALVSAGKLRGRDQHPRTPGQLQARSYVPVRPGEYPAASISLRSASAGSFDIVQLHSGELLGSTEEERAFATVHEGAIYMHLGRQYQVVALDLQRRRALVAPFDGDWYTQPKIQTEMVIERLHQGRSALAVQLCFGEVCVTQTVTAYARKRIADHSQLDLNTLALPQSSFQTQAVWFQLEVALAEIPLQAMLSALHATEHAQIAVLPLLAMCDRWDIGGLSTNLHPQTSSPTIFIYDGYPGGIGIAEVAFARFEELCANALRLIAECPCEQGCPSCVQSPKCGNLNEPLSKHGAQMLLESMCGGGTPLGCT